MKLWEFPDSKGKTKPELLGLRGANGVRGTSEVSLDLYVVQRTQVIPFINLLTSSLLTPQIVAFIYVHSPGALRPRGSAGP